MLGINDSNIQEHLFLDQSNKNATFYDVEKFALNYESALLNSEMIESVMKTEHCYSPSLNVNKITPKGILKKKKKTVPLIFLLVNNSILILNQ